MKILFYLSSSLTLLSLATTIYFFVKINISRIAEDSYAYGILLVLALIPLIFFGIITGLLALWIY